MKISDSYIKDARVYKEANITVPSYDQDIIKEKTNEDPKWLHFGGGNLYRCFHAKVAQDLLNQNEMNSGIVVVDNFGKELIENIYNPNHCRSLSVVMKSDGSFEKELIAATSYAYFNNPSNSCYLNEINRIFKNKSLQLVTFTITEKGYGVKKSDGELLDSVISDINNGPVFEKLISTMAQIAYYLYERFKINADPLALVSTDNFSHNGERLKNSLKIIITGWVENELVPYSFYEYVFKSKKISFPYSMIDRITPIPSEEISRILLAEGIEGMELIQLPKSPPIAAFVNTEESCYLVIEDDFPNGRPALEKVKNVFLSDKETVNKTDLMKVTACLNPLHTAIAIIGSLLDYQVVFDAIQDEDILKLVELIGYKESLPVVKNPGIINPKKFIDEVIYKRLMNPNVPDTPQRIATDTSQKLSIRYGETISSYVTDEKLDPTDLVYIPFVIASWCRYLIGITDLGSEFTPSPDPLYSELSNRVKRFSLGRTYEVQEIHEALYPILSNTELFGNDLYEIGLGDKIEKLFIQMMSQKGAVRTTLQNLIKEEK